MKVLIEWYGGTLKVWLAPNHNQTVGSSCNGTLDLSNVGGVIAAEILCETSLILFSAPAGVSENRSEKQVVQFIKTTEVIPSYAII